MKTKLKRKPRHLCTFVLKNMTGDGSRANYRGARFRSPLHSTESSTLIVYFNFFQVVLSVLFEKKYPKTWSVVYGIRCFLCSQIANSIRCCNILQSVHTSPVAACHNAWGGKNSLRSNIMPPVSAHCSAARCASQRCPFAFGDELLL